MINKKNNSKDLGNQKLPKSFYLQEDVVDLAQQLLGKVLVSNIDGNRTSGIIVETEAYRGRDDKAAHSYNNKRTKRTSIMFEEGGVCYVYLIYGIHALFNVIIGPKDQADGVLVRAIEPLEGIDQMLHRRNMQHAHPQLTAGPGVLTKALGITTQHNGLDLSDPDSYIWIEDHYIKYTSDEIIASPRVNIDYAEESVDWPWRFRIKTSKWTSKAK
ncbi:MAG: DNA-3-methyladenine glycosylase [Bacteroidota bacterium]